MNPSRQIAEGSSSWQVTNDRGCEVNVIQFHRLFPFALMDYSEFCDGWREIYRENLPEREANFRIATFLITDDFGKTVVVQHHVNEFGYYKLLTHV
jgi:hypothetical protein